MKIYVASSWRNPFQPAVVEVLRAAGHEVYDFRNPGPGDNGFGWSEIDRHWKGWTVPRYRECLQHPRAQDGFAKDMEALRSCDACVLVMPCGRSAHLELGWAVGAGRRTCVLFPDDPTLPAKGHSMHLGGACPACGDLDGCHLPAAVRHPEPELMYLMCGAPAVTTAREVLDFLKA